MSRLDTHQHLLHPGRFGYSWTNDFPVLQSAFTLEDYWRAAEGCGIEGTLFMEVDVDDGQCAGEAFYFCELAQKQGNGLCGVIASGRPENEGFARHLDAIAHPALKGIRRILHTQSYSVSQSVRFRENVAALAKHGLTFDICALQKQLPIAVELIDACPRTSFILDHCGVPDIAGGDFDDWSKSIHELAERDNVACKISGIIAYVPAGAEPVATLRPYIETVIDAFGWDRVIWGGDWPVCNLTASLRQWCDTLDAILAKESTDSLEKLYSSNAKRIYNLKCNESH